MILYLAYRLNGLPCVDRVMIDGTSEARVVKTEPFEATDSLKVRNHSPDGFEWGYGGSGPSQLALALLLDATENQGDIAARYYMRYKDAHVRAWPHAGFVVTQDALLTWLEAMQQANG